MPAPLIASSILETLVAHWDYFIPGALGGLVLELLHLQIYRGRLNSAKYRTLLSSPLYWICVTALVIAAGLVALCIHANEDTADIVKLFMTGIAVRTIVREGASLRKPRYLGAAAPRSEGRITLRDIFN
jgi:hypothetical protein